MLFTTLLTLHIAVAFLLIALVLVQKGSNRSVGTEGASQTVFGSQGSKSFMTRLTGTVAGLLVMTSLGLRLFAPSETMDALTLLSTPPQQDLSIVNK